VRFFPLCQDDQVQYRITCACPFELIRQAIWFLEFMNEATIISAVHSSSLVYGFQVGLSVHLFDISIAIVFSFLLIAKLTKPGI